MLTIDNSHLPLAEEFRQKPLGPHSAALHDLLRIMRWADPTDRFISVQPERDGPWYLAKTQGAKSTSLAVYCATPFATQEEAAWAVFRKRWEMLSGTPLTLPSDGPDPCAGPATPSEQLVVPRILAYADTFSVAQSDAIAFKVSAPFTGYYHAQLVRLRSGDHTHVGLKTTPCEAPVNGTYPCRVQPLQAGSYAWVRAAQGWPVARVGLQCTLWPTTPEQGAEQALLGTWDATSREGFALYLDHNGALALRVGDRETEQVVTTGVPLMARHWYQVAATFDVTTHSVSLAQFCHSHYALANPNGYIHTMLTVRPTPQRLLHLAAWANGADMRAAFFNGKLEAPAIHAETYTDDAMRALAFNGTPIQSATTVFAQWDFSRGIDGTEIIDTGHHGHDGTVENMPTRAVKGSTWDGTEYNWCHKPEHYAAIHFHDDDLYDCHWQTDFTLTVPDTLASGLYAMHLRTEESEDWVPFVVRPPTGKTNAPLALLLPSASYWAYANRHTVIDFPGREQVRCAFTSADATGLYLHHHPALGLSMYDAHSDGAGVCYSSRLRPVLSLRPGEALWQLPADTHIIDWLEEQAIAYDIITEDDLDAHGYALLASYRCVMTGTHPEYPSLAMLDAFSEYQANGGRFIYMGGNGFYWRVSYHPKLPGLMEMRRAEDGIRAWQAEGGEYYHASTGELGGMWRRMGRAPQSVAGTGMTAQGFDRSTGYRRTQASLDPRVAFAFEGIGETEIIGDFGIIGGGAAGWEIDRADEALGTAPHALVVAQATDFSAGYHWMKEELHHTHSAITGPTCPLVRSDMVFYETPRGGAVFSVSSIAFAGALSHNSYRNNVSTLLSNVVCRFLDPRPFL